jgi:hypothetical protein
MQLSLNQLVLRQAPYEVNKDTYVKIIVEGKDWEYLL